MPCDSGSCTPSPLKTVTVSILLKKEPKGPRAKGPKCQRPKGQRATRAKGSKGPKRQTSSHRSKSSGWPRFGSVTAWLWNDSSGSGFRFPRLLSGRECSCVSVQIKRGGRFRFRFLKIGSGGSSSDFGSWKNGSDGSGFRFRFDSWVTLKINCSKSHSNLLQ